MKKIFTTLFSIAIFSLSVSAQSNLTFHDYSAVTIVGDTLDFSQYYGKKVMVVNTASYCAYTPQFAGLEDLYTQYHQYNFEIIGFPCNDFGSQDPHDDSTINEFCTSNYGVTFQMMSKIATVSADTAPVYKWLQRADLNGVANAHVSWNFNKFLIDEAGHWVNHFVSAVDPLDTAITNWILSPSVISSVSEVQNASGNFSINSSNQNQIEIVSHTSSKEATIISVYSIEGKMIDNIYNGAISDNQKITFNSSSLPSGIYLLRIEGKSVLDVLKFVVAR